MGDAPVLVVTVTATDDPLHWRVMLEVVIASETSAYAAGAVLGALEGIL